MHSFLRGLFSAFMSLATDLEALIAAGVTALAAGDYATAKAKALAAKFTLIGIPNFQKESIGIQYRNEIDSLLRDIAIAQSAARGIITQPIQVIPDDGTEWSSSAY